MIQQNRHKYSVSAMCKVLKIARSTFYYDTEISAQKQQEKREEEQILKDKIDKLFNENRQVYGTRKLKKELDLENEGFPTSRRRIGRLMGELGLQSKYAKASYKPMMTRPNEGSSSKCIKS